MIHPLRQWRIDNELTLAKTAARLGVTPGHISLLERRRRGASLKLASAIKKMTGGKLSLIDLDGSYKIER